MTVCLPVKIPVDEQNCALVPCNALKKKKRETRPIFHFDLKKEKSGMIR